MLKDPYNLIKNMLIKDNGKMAKNMEKANRCGKMVLIIKAIGLMIWHLDLED